MGEAMLVKDEKGNELLELIRVEEAEAENYSPINCALGVVKLGDDYLLGWNHWRQDWEVFGGCREDGETMRQCMDRECREELGLQNLEWTFLGLMHCKMAPGYFDPEWHEEYGGVYGVTLPADCLETIEKHRADREEIEKLAFYREVTRKEKIAAIDEKLLEFWR